MDPSTPLHLLDVLLTAMAGPWSESTAWWSPGAAGAVGGGLGAFVGGIGGGVGGPMAGVWARRGKHRGLVMGFFAAFAGLGYLLLLGGLTALIMGQPYHVWYCLLLPGAIAAPLFSILLPRVRTAYQEAERNKLEAEELRRS